MNHMAKAACVILLFEGYAFQTDDCGKIRYGFFRSLSTLFVL